MIGEGADGRKQGVLRDARHLQCVLMSGWHKVTLSDGVKYEVRRTAERTFKAQQEGKILWTDGCASVREALLQASDTDPIDPAFLRSLVDAEAVITERSVWPTTRLARLR
jgi:hypothetical protein